MKIETVMCGTHGCPNVATQKIFCSHEDILSGRSFRDECCNACAAERLKIPETKKLDEVSTKYDEMLAHAQSVYPAQMMSEEYRAKMLALVSERDLLRWGPDFGKPDYIDLRDAEIASRTASRAQQVPAG